MSRHLGHLEQSILAALKLRSGLSPILSTSEIARHIFGAGASRSQIISLRRALSSLVRKKLIEPKPSGPRGENTWQRRAIHQRKVHYENRPDLTRLAKLLGMCGSQHQGERDAAALAIERERKRLGGNWLQILRVRT